MAIAILQASRKGKPIKTKEFDLTENGTHYLLPYDGYSLDGAIVNVNVQPREQNKTLEIYENGEYAVEAEDGETLTKVTVIADVPGTDGDKGLIDGSATSYAIPDGVTAIKNYCFYGQNNLKHVKIPESVKLIGGYAFGYCASLKSITLPDSLTGIWSYAFEGCTSLTSIKVPAGVTSIGAYAFKDCSNCLEYDFSNHESVPNLIGSESFRGCSDKMKIIVPIDLYDEWTAATNWATYKDHIIGFGAKSAPKEENFDIFVGARLLQEIVNYNSWGIKLATGVGKNELLSECGVPYLRIYGDGSSLEAYAQIKNIEGKTTGKYLVFAYRLPTSNAEDHAYFEIYSNTTNGSFSGKGDVFTLSTQKDGRWHVVAVDIAEAISTSPSVIGGSESQFIANSDGSYTIQKLRIDWFNRKTSTDSYVDVAYVGVCDALEDARNADGDYEGAEFDGQRIKNRCDDFSINARIQRLENGMEYVKIIRTTASGTSGREAFVPLYTNGSLIFPNVGEYAAVLFRGPENTETSAKKGSVEIWLDSVGNGLDGSETHASIGYGDLTTGECGNNGWYWGIADLTSSPYSDSVCRMIRLDYLNSVNPATEYEIDIAFLKFFGSEDEAREYCEDYMKKYDLI